MSTYEDADKWRQENYFSDSDLLLAAYDAAHKSAPKDGGEAFTSTHTFDGRNISYLGMTLRDWFAGQAMNALFSHPEMDKILAEGNEGNESNGQVLARYSYEVADAMIAERNK